MSAPGTPTIGELLGQQRTAAGLTQEELAERARMSIRAISDLERGVRRTLHKDTLRLLAEALKLSEDDEALLFEAVCASRRTSEGVPRHSDAARWTRARGGGHRTAGIGKTRLATQTAMDHDACFANVVFVSLAAISEHSLQTENQKRHCPPSRR